MKNRFDVILIKGERKYEKEGVILVDESAIDTETLEKQDKLLIK